MYVIASLCILFSSANIFLISSVIFVISNSPFHFYYVVAFYTFSRDFRCLGRDSRHHAPPRRTPTARPTACPTTAHSTTARPHHGAPHHVTSHHGTPHHGTLHHGTTRYGITHRYDDTSHCSFSTHFIVIIIFYKGNN